TQVPMVSGRLLLGTEDYSAWAKPHLARVLAAGPASMPKLPRSHVDKVMERLAPSLPPRRGHPRLGESKSQRETVCFAAWLAAARAQTRDEIARFLDNSSPNTPVARPARRKAERYVAAGRNVLWLEGVLPWIAWPDGQVPGDWPATLLFNRALALWYEVYV